MLPTTSWPDCLANGPQIGVPVLEQEDIGGAGFSGSYDEHDGGADDHDADRECAERLGSVEIARATDAIAAVRLRRFSGSWLWSSSTEMLPEASLAK